MLQNIADLTKLLPEIIILTAACSVLLLGVCSGKARQKHDYTLLGITVLSMVGAMYCSLGLETAPLYINRIQIIAMSLMLLGFIYNAAYVQEHHIDQSEYYSLSLFALLGVMVLINANTLLTLYLGLELIALPFYALVACDKHEGGLGGEAAMKYFILGSLASGMLLYGISLIFGATGDLTLANMVNITTSNTQLLACGWVFIFAGLAFKLGAVPLHNWLPDVYQGAPTPIVLFLSGAPKIAVLLLLIKVNLIFSSTAVYWPNILAAVALISMLVGTLFAIAQSNFKRMLGYSAIANLGFILCALLSKTPFGNSAALYYIVIYAITITGTLGILNVLKFENISDFKGLVQSSPFLAGCITVYMFSMIGIPPAAGFYAKFLVLADLLHTNYLNFAVILLILNVVGAIYYLNIIKVMYFDNTVVLNEQKAKRKFSAIDLLVGLNVLALLFLGVFPQYLLEFIQ